MPAPAFIPQKGPMVEKDCDMFSQSGLSSATDDDGDDHKLNGIAMIMSTRLEICFCIVRLLKRKSASRSFMFLFFVC